MATYIQIYNAIGFLMHIEVDWVHRMIWKCRRPVIAIKPLAAGSLLPLVGLAFAWSTLRDQDMVCVGTSSPDEVAGGRGTQPFDPGAPPARGRPSADAQQGNR